MLYTTGLEEIIFHRHEIFGADELIVLSGFLGPAPVERLAELPFPSRVIYGMYGSEGIKPRLHNSLLDLQNGIDKVNIFYSNIPVHSKCYVWKRNNVIVHALVGSANFSTNGLRTPFREVLAETTFDTFEPLNAYIQTIFNSSISCLEAVARQVVIPALAPITCSLTLLAEDGEVQGTAGLNWGQNPRNHTRPNDAYIKIRTQDIRNFPVFFPPKQLNPIHIENRGRPYRHNDNVEIIWDDGVIMDALFEGSQPINNIVFPKQISSFPRKSDLGEYIRLRIGVPSGQPVRRHHLNAYGRTDISVSMIGEGIYEFDFSV